MHHEALLVYKNMSQKTRTCPKTVKRTAASYDQLNKRSWTKELINFAS